MPLAAHGVIERKVYAEVPPKVEYSLTEFGQTLEPILGHLKAWGEKFLERLKKNSADAGESSGTKST